MLIGEPPIRWPVWQHRIPADRQTAVCNFRAGKQCQAKAVTNRAGFGLVGTQFAAIRMPHHHREMAVKATAAIPAAQEKLTSWPLKKSPLSIQRWGSPIQRSFWTKPVDHGLRMPWRSVCVPWRLSDKFFIVNSLNFFCACCRAFESSVLSMVRCTHFISSSLRLPPISE